MTSLHLRGARVVGAGPEPIEIVVDRGRITDLGPSVQSAPDADPIELDGRFVVPGLWDHHVHLGQWASTSGRLDVSRARSAAEARSIVAARLKASVPPLLVGSGFRDALWPDEPTADLLEFGDVPVVLVSADLHCVWGNRAAFARLGRPGGGGLLREAEAYDASTRLAALDADALDERITLAARAAAARGVVGVVDFEMDDAPAAWARRAADGFDLLRVGAAVYPDRLEEAVAAGRRTGDPLGGLAAVGPLKIFADGSLNTRTASTRAAYADDPQNHGVPAHGDAELVELVRLGAAAGLVPAVHAIGDLAVTRALDAFEAVGCRGSIEHAQVVADADVSRFARLGVVASVQPEHAMDDRDITEALWPATADRAFPLASLAASGATLRFGSDAPVAPLDPWVAMAAAVTRARDGRTPWHPEQRVPFEAALAASTAGPLAVGAVADLAVCDADPASATGDGLRAMRVALTVLGGRVTHRAL